MEIVGVIWGQVAAVVGVVIIVHPSEHPILAEFHQKLRQQKAALPQAKAHHHLQR